VDGFVDDTNEAVVGPLGVKFAVTDSGALMVTVVEALLASATLPRSNWRRRSRCLPSPSGSR
jgi:hypothetical protein